MAYTKEMQKKHLMYNRPSINAK